MWNQAIPIKQRTKTDGLELLSVWAVNASPAYHVVWKKDWYADFPPNAHVAWFTLQGQGRVSLGDGRSIELHENSLLFTSLHDISSYCCSGPAWQFFWIAFVIPLPAPVPVFEPIALPGKSHYQREVAAMIRALRQGTDAQRALAAATFQKLLYEWLTLTENQRRDIPYLAKIEQVIEDMHNRLDGSLSVQKMAKTAGMSEVVFRRRFKTVTGQSPKKFYLDLRLDQAEALLYFGQQFVDETAAALGFYDQFHFSKMFKKRFGKSPSSLRSRQA